MIAATTRIGLTWKRVTKSVRSIGMLVMLTNSANISAPIRIRNSIEVVRAVSTSAGEGGGRKREDEGARGADPGALGGGEHAAVDSAHHQREQRDHTGYPPVDHRQGEHRESA